MVQAGGSASWTINDSDTPDPGGGHHPAWKRPKDDTHRPDGPRTHMVSQPWRASLRLKKNRRDRAIPDRASVVVERSGHPVPDDTPRRVVGFYDNQTVLDLLVDSNTDVSGDPVPMPAPSELAEHSTSVEHSAGRCSRTVRASGEYTTWSGGVF